jgi:hypothetical protein
VFYRVLFPHDCAAGTVRHVKFLVCGTPFVVKEFSLMIDNQLTKHTPPLVPHRSLPLPLFLALAARWQTLEVKRRT